MMTSAMYSSDLAKPVANSPFQNAISSIDQHGQHRGRCEKVEWAAIIRDGCPELAMKKKKASYIPISVSFFIAKIERNH